MLDGGAAAGALAGVVWLVLCGSGTSACVLDGGAAEGGSVEAGDGRGVVL